LLWSPTIWAKNREFSIVHCVTAAAVGQVSREYEILPPETGCELNGFLFDLPERPFSWVTF
jgi:hypothetical protein